ncbi:MaoC family dehydratase [Actinokineospora guangxiensis]|uniref:MaoC family dehydratase n=1 Tax=Actinokineospora guangxiensis TaxID=1490288 RepID=A0ABW0EWU1_9PSEU
MPGRYFEQFAVGDVYVHVPSRTVTEADNVIFSTMTMNPQPLHLDVEFARGTEHGRPVVNGMFTLALMMGLTVHDTTLGTTLGNLGFSSITYHAPVFAGDTLTAETEVVGARASRSKSDRGVVEFEHRARNQRGDLVITCRRAGMMMRAPATSEAAS